MTTTQLEAGVILKGYNSMENALEVKDYPYGFRLRTSIFYWIETKKGKGDRFCTRTINPKNGRFNAPKCSTYSPFLYLQTNEQGHVTTGGLTAYNQELFEARFYFVLKNLYPFYISEDQQHNIRMDYLAHIVGSMPWNKVKYSEDTIQDYTNWCSGIIKHIKTCPFENLVEYPTAPEPDQPDAERKFIVGPIEKPEPITHEITPEKIVSLLEKTLPGFYVNAEQYNGFGGDYIKISIAANAEKVMRVTLSLNLKDLDLTPQQYGGSGGQWIYRDIDPNDPKEKYLAMKSVKIPFRTPAKNEKDVLRGIELFAINYKKTLIQYKDVLKGREHVDLPKLLNIPA